MFSRPRIPLRSILTEGALPSGLQRRLYRKRGYRIAPDVHFAPGVVIEADEVEIGPGSSLGFATVIRGKSVRIGRRVEIGAFSIFDGRDIVIGDDTVIREQVYVGGPLSRDSFLEIGKRVRVFQTCFLNPSRPLRIGDDTGVGGRSSIFTHGSWQSAVDGYPVTFQPVTIGRNVWLPWHVFILPGVEIGDNATIGAGSLINRSVPAGTFAAGVPARVLKTENEWPRPISGQEQWSLARSIFSELVDHFEDNGVSAQRSESDGRADATLSYNGSARKVALVARSSDASTSDQIVIALDWNGANPGRTASWFSLRDKRKGGLPDPVSAEVESFFGRYGIRFAPVDEE